MNLNVFLEYFNGFVSNNVDQLSGGKANHEPPLAGCPRDEQLGVCESLVRPHFPVKSNGPGPDSSGKFHGHETLGERNI